MSSLADLSALRFGSPRSAAGRFPPRCEPGHGAALEVVLLPPQLCNTPCPPHESGTVLAPKSRWWSGGVIPSAAGPPRPTRSAAV